MHALCLYPETFSNNSRFVCQAQFSSGFFVNFLYNGYQLQPVFGYTIAGMSSNPVVIEHV